MKGSGSMINSMAMELRVGPMVLAMRGIMKTAKKKEMVNLLLLMAAFTKVNSEKMKSLEMDATSGLMARHMKETGKKTKCTGLES